MALLIRDDVSPLPHPQTSARRPRYFDAALAVLGLAAAFLILMDIGGAPLAAFKLVVCLALPGWVVLSRLPAADRASRLVWTVAASAAVYTTLALAMAWTGFWYPRQGAAVIVLASVCFIVLKPGPYLPGTFVRGAAPGGPRPSAAGGREPHGRSRFNALVPWLSLAAAADLWV